MPTETKDTAPPTKDVKLMSLAEIECELDEMEARRKLLLRVRRLLVELAGE